jgi:hypothetical protein
MFILMTSILKDFTEDFLVWFHLFYVMRKLNSYYALYFSIFENRARYSESFVSIFPRMRFFHLYEVKTLTRYFVCNDAKKIVDE